jgi:hypothetical protein
LRVGASIRELRQCRFWLCLDLFGLRPGDDGAGSGSAELRADETALGQFPESAGNYTLARRWNETLITGDAAFSLG